MIKGQHLLLGALVTAAGFLGQGFTDSAEAILFSVNAIIGNNNGTVEGTFEYSNNSYSNVNITVDNSIAFNTIYTTEDVNTELSNIGLLALAQDTDPQFYLSLDFDGDLPNVIGSQTFLLPGDVEAQPNAGSYVRGVSSQLSVEQPISSGAVTAVPFESDVLPLVGATILFAGGMWLKRKRAEKSLALLRETQEIE